MRFVFTHLHHEPFLPEASDWSFSTTGPLSGANGALPWILFERDRRQFERAFPEWSIEAIRLHTPFRYLVSGGVSMRNLMPTWTFGMWTRLERLLRRQMRHLAMFALVILRRAGTPP